MQAGMLLFVTVLVILDGINRSWHAKYYIEEISQRHARWDGEKPGLEPLIHNH